MKRITVPEDSVATLFGSYDEHLKLFESLYGVRIRTQGHELLVDGDDEGYLLQIFTKNAIGPIFFEIIQRKGNEGFGEGNFQALFDSIELDQIRRGVIKVDA